MELIHPAHHSTAATRLMIVDDHALLGAGLVQLFGNAPAIGKVTAVTGVEEGVRVGKWLQPNVVLLDAVLPDIGPAEAARRILWACPLAKLMFLDDSVSELRIRIALSVGALAYWTKHATFDQLAAAVSQVAAGQPAFCVQAQEYVIVTPTGLRFRPSRQSGALSQLMKREWEVLGYLAKGLTVRQSAQRMHISPSTADNHKTRLMRKLNTHKVTDLVQLAWSQGLVGPSPPQPREA